MKISLHRDGECPVSRSSHVVRVIAHQNLSGPDYHGGPLRQYRGERTMESLNAPNLRFWPEGTWYRERFGEDFDYLYEAKEVPNHPQF